MGRLRACTCRALGLAAWLLLAVGPFAAPVGAQVPPWFGGYPGMGSFPGSGMLPDPSYYYGIAGLSGFGGFPGAGMLPGMDSYYGMAGGLPFGGLPGFPGGAGLPGYGGYPTSTAASSASTAASATQNVRLTIGDNFFLPAEISVPAGTQVTWLNTGSVRHTTTASGLWDSGAIDPGARWAAVFRVPGSYDYACTIHPEMRGRLTITAS
jgi:plastocyanin